MQCSTLGRDRDPAAPAVNRPHVLVVPLFLRVKSRDARHCLRRKLKKLDMALFNKHFKAS